MEKFIVSLAALLFICFTNAQQLFMTTNIQNVYKKKQDGNWKTRYNYWQNKTNYNIQVSFDPATQLLQGKETIHYMNNSPDTLKEVIVRLYIRIFIKKE